MTLHGIFSDEKKSMGTLKHAFERDPRFRGWLSDNVRYDWWEPINDNAAIIKGKIQNHIADGAGPVTIVAHSMGGLVARRAILTMTDQTVVRRLIMIATPNFGALSTSQLGLLTQPLATGSKYIVGNYLKAPGLADLTRVDALFKDDVARAASTDVEYVTIPATYFHEQRAIFDLAAFSLQPRPLWLVPLLSEFAVAVLGTSVKISMKRPHDGIVEERSVNFVPARSGRWSEKTRSINHLQPSEKSYLHASHSSADNLSHTTIIHDATIIELILDLVSSESLPQWLSSLAQRDQDRLEIES